MRVNGLGWLGTRTENFEEMVAFLRDVLELRVSHEESGFTAFKLPNGDLVEVFGPEDREHGHFTTGPVVGFTVDDLDRARAKMEAAGIEFLGAPMSSGGYSWAHFRAPDGNVYEITSGAPP